MTAVVLLFALTGCSDPGDLQITNTGPDEVTVSTGDQVVTVTPGGGVFLLKYGCTPGEVTVRFPAGSTVTLPGPVCPDQRIVIGDGAARLRSSSTTSG